VIAASPASSRRLIWNATDDAVIDDPGKCKVESWASAASNHDFSAVTSPGCVVKLGIPIEFDGILQRLRSSDVWSTSGTLQAKTILVTVENHPFGLGIVGGNTWDLASGASTGGYIYVPVTIPVNATFKINI
jgi:hypothetical protein